MALMSVKNPDDALDIVQDVMMTLARKYAGKSPAEWRPLFFRMLQNRITDWHRSSMRYRRLFGWLAPDPEDDQDPIENAPGAEQDRPEHQLRMDGAREQIVDAVAALPDRQRQAFMLRAWEGLDVAGTAEVMGCSQGSVKTHYSRAVHTLRDALQEFRDD